MDTVAGDTPVMDTGSAEGGDLRFYRMVWHGISDYWKSQIPFVSDWKRSFEDEKYWQDYRKNTGFTPRYPYRTYGTSGSGAIMRTVSYSKRAMKKIYG